MASALLTCCILVRGEASRKGNKYIFFHSSLLLNLKSWRDTLQHWPRVANLSQTASCSLGWDGDGRWIVAAAASVDITFVRYDWDCFPTQNWNKKSNIRGERMRLHSNRWPLFWQWYHTKMHGPPTVWDLTFCFYTPKGTFVTHQPPLKLIQTT